MIIAISGKKNSGKDTICKIIQYLIAKYNLKHDLAPFKECLEIWSFEEKMNPNCGTSWLRQAFASKPKQMVCLLIGCTMEQLEDQEFKETPLGEEWECWIIPNGTKYPEIFPIDTDIEWIARGNKYFKKQMTPRMLLQLLGTECGRNIIHPNIWVNALMNEYKPLGLRGEFIKRQRRSLVNPFYGDKKHEFGTYKYYVPREAIKGKNINTYLHTPEYAWYEKLEKEEYPNWIITDCRFLNETMAIKKRDGIIIRVNRPSIVSTDTHQSEIELDNYQGFNRIISNDGTIEKLIEEVQFTLEMFKII